MSLHLLSWGHTELTLLWEKTGSDGMDGGARYVSITEDGGYVTTGTRGGCRTDRGSQILVFNGDGGPVFTERGAYMECTVGEDGNQHPQSEVWFARISSDGSRIAFAGWGGYAYFYEIE